MKGFRGKLVELDIGETRIVNRGALDATQSAIREVNPIDKGSLGKKEKQS